MGIVGLKNEIDDLIKALSSDPEEFVYKASNGIAYKIYKNSYSGDYYIDDGLYDFDQNTLMPSQYQSFNECIEAIEKHLETVEKIVKARNSRIEELKKAFEESGRKQNFAEPTEIDSLGLSLTEKKIMQQCRRPQCHGCKLGWVCPKFWA